MVEKGATQRTIGGSSSSNTKLPKALVVSLHILSDLSRRAVFLVWRLDGYSYIVLALLLFWFFLGFKVDG